MGRSWLIIALSLAVAGPAICRPASAAPLPLDAAVERGHDLAMRRCSECHAVRRSRESPNGDAPPFVTLRLRHNELSLERRLADVSWGEHAGMPPTGLTAEDRTDLAAYIQSLESPRP